MSLKFRIGISFVNILAILFAAFSIGVAIAAMCHVQWIYYGVNLSSVNNTQLIQYVSRWRGMFVECPENPNAQILDSLGSQKISPGCFNLDMRTVYNGDANYGYIIALRRTHVAMFVSGLFCTTMGIFLILGAICTWGCSTSGMSAYRKVSFFTGFLCIIGALCYIASMLVFHVGLDEEKWYQSVLLPWIFSVWTSDVISATDISFNVGYGLGWAACIATLISGMFMWINYCCIASYEEDLIDSIPIVIDGGHDNPSFENSNYYLHKNTGNYGPSNYNYNDRPFGSPGAQRLPVYSAQDQESHYSSKNIYRIY
jgi:hypothetical protein